MTDLLYKTESYQTLGICMEVHHQLGGGFLEVVYKDALEIEFKAASLFYEREKEYLVNYKGIILPHKFYADFVVLNKIILEVKGCKAITDEHISTALNYCKVSGCRLALLVNFGRDKLEYKRLIF